MSGKYNWGCGKKITVYVPRGYDNRAVEVECGSTAHDGNINQCNECEVKHPYSPVRDDESDADWYERQD